MRMIKDTAISLKLTTEQRLKLRKLALSEALRLGRMVSDSEMVRILIEENFEDEHDKAKPQKGIPR